MQLLYLLLDAVMGALCCGTIQAPNQLASMTQNQLLMFVSCFFARTLHHAHLFNLSSKLAMFIIFSYFSRFHSDWKCVMEC
jgi:hypothetical protein